MKHLKKNFKVVDSLDVISLMAEHDEPLYLDDDETLNTTFRIINNCIADLQKNGVITSNLDLW